MRIDIITLFPGFFTSPLNESILSRAIETGTVTVEVHNLRSFTRDKHQTCDDRPYGGGPGMVIKPEPIWHALKHIRTNYPIKKSQTILFNPRGRILNQQVLRELISFNHLVLICGHYEGVDERVRYWAHQEISLGDYILTGGEIPALALMDGIVRLLPEVLGNKRSLISESFTGKFLDYPQYTRPRQFQRLRVPLILLKGNHLQIDRWRKMQRLQQTYIHRSDLLDFVHLSPNEKKVVKNLEKKCKK